MGTLTLAPMRDDLICACPNLESAIYPRVIELGLKLTGISSLPSASCLYTPFPAAHVNSSDKTPKQLHYHHPRCILFLALQVSNAPLSSSTIPSNASLMSARTSSSQFSFIDSAQLVCCRKRCSSPHFMPDIWGREETTWSVMRCEPRPSEGSVRWCWVYVVAMAEQGSGLRQRWARTRARTRMEIE